MQLLLSIADKGQTLIGLKCDFCPFLRYTRSEYTKYSFARDALTGTKIPILNLQGNREKEFLNEKGVAKRRNTGVLQATRLSLRRKVDLSTMSVRLFSAIQFIGFGELYFFKHFYVLIITTVQIAHYIGHFV